MKQFLVNGAGTVVVLLLAATSASALPIRIDACTSGPCNTEGGSVDVSLEFFLAGDLTISATNNLVSGAVTQLGFNFEPLEPWVNPILFGFTAVTGAVTLLNLTSFCLNEPDPPGMCTGPFDLSLTFPTTGTNAWSPGETIFLGLRLILAPEAGGGRVASISGYAQIEGACAPGNPAPCLPTGIGGSESYQLSGGPVTVPDESSTFMLTAMGFVACLLVGRRCRLTPTEGRTTST
jgi:hypothetical protein